MEWGVVFGVLVGAAVGVSLPVLYRRNVGHELDERVGGLKKRRLSKFFKWFRLQADWRCFIWPSWSGRRITWRLPSFR